MLKSKLRNKYLVQKSEKQGYYTKNKEMFAFSHGKRLKKSNTRTYICIMLQTQKGFVKQ